MTRITFDIEWRASERFDWELSKVGWSTETEARDHIAKVTAIYGPSVATSYRVVRVETTETREVLP